MPRGSTRAWREQRARILKASDICWLCGKPGANSIDHVIAVDRGGTDHPTNLKPAHMTCNQTKSNKDYSTKTLRTSRDW